jgi:phage protein D
MWNKHGVNNHLEFIPQLATVWSESMYPFGLFMMYHSYPSSSSPSIHWVARGTGTPKDKDEETMTINLFSRTTIVVRKKGREKKGGKKAPEASSGVAKRLI